MDDILALIKGKSIEIFNELKFIRQHLHKHPELSFEEHETAAFVAQRLDAMGISYKSGLAGTGIIGSIIGTKENCEKKRIVALRADMDALPIVEENQIDYKSLNAGKMHACGHDVHTASLLGAAKILASIKDQFSGTVLLVFQPGEERIPGGAKLLLEAGALDNPKPDLVIGQHVMPSMEVGTIGFREGLYMASSDEVFLTIRGKGGHAAMPHDITDTVLIASHIIVALQQIVSRNANASTPTVLSFGKIISNGAVNVIPSEVRIEGTFRTMDEEWRAKAKLKIANIAQSIAHGMGAECEVEIRHGYPFLVNNETITQQAKDFAKTYLPPENVEDMSIRMTAEDFAYYSQKFPACFFRLGTGNKSKGITSQLHTSTFDIDEEALKIGAGMMAWLAYSFLND
ncbi:MAG: amidohydrolase [Bacteroidales bacterium]|nr:amidohydrolase [Bacteroidales bacterium]MCF8455443.1 amidohydrolase [Bacteroidales bacterium]